MPGEDRGNMAVVIAVFFGTVAAAAFLWIILNQAWEPMMSMASNHSSTANTSEGIGRARTAWRYAPVWVFSMLIVLGIAGAAAAKRRGL